MPSTRKWRASLPRLAVLAEPLQTPMAGSTVLEGTATGPLDALEVRADLAGRDLLLSGRNVPRADLAVRATQLPGSPRGTLTARPSWTNSRSTPGPPSRWKAKG